MAEGNISYKLDLVVYLLDTTTGYPIEQKEVLFRKNGSVLAMLSKGAGVYILLNHDRIDAQLEISVKGYLSRSIALCYEKLDAQYPALEVPLIPELPTYGCTDICTLEGSKRGITDIVAISMTQTDAMLGAYNARKNTLRLFESRRLDEERYAIFHEEIKEFEEFRIVSKSDRGMQLQLKDSLTQECKPEESIVRIVHGMTDAKGRYLLRMRKDGKGTRYLVRYTVRGKTRFQEIEFGEQNERGLE